MSKYTMTSFIIGMIFVSLVAAGLGVFMSSMNDTYTRSDYNETDLETFDKMKELSNLSEQMRDETEIQTDSGVLDVIGSYFKSAYQALRTSTSSISLFTSMANDAGEESGIQNVRIITTALITVVLIALFVGVLISAMVKKDV